MSLHFSIVNAAAHASVHTTGIFMSQIVLLVGNFSKFLDVLSVIGCKSYKLSKDGYICRNWPVLNTRNFLGMHIPIKVCPK